MLYLHNNTFETHLKKVWIKYTDSKACKNIVQKVTGQNTGSLVNKIHRLAAKYESYSTTAPKYLDTNQKVI
jgi:hypothetical protein